MTSQPPPDDTLQALKTARLEQIAAATVYDFVNASAILGSHVDNLLDHYDTN